MSKRWSSEYVKSLKEQHHKSGRSPASHPSNGDLVIARDETQNRNQWKLAIVTNLIVGRDGAVRAAKIRTSKGTLEHAIQHLYSLELSCATNSRLNPADPEFHWKPQIDAATALHIRDISELPEH